MRQQSDDQRCLGWDDYDQRGVALETATDKLGQTLQHTAPRHYSLRKRTTFDKEEMAALFGGGFDSSDNRDCLDDVAAVRTTHVVHPCSIASTGDEMTDSSEKQIRSRKSPPLDPEADQALGTVSPELAWLQVGGLVMQFVERYPDLANAMARKMDLDMNFEELDELLQLIDPVAGINQLHYIQSDINLREVDHQDPVLVLKGVIRMLTISDRMNRPSPGWKPVSQLDATSSE
jgi:hypothetical protein